jgi:RecA-family ATPase
MKVIDTAGLVEETILEPNGGKPNGNGGEAPLPYVDLAADLEPRPWLIADRIPRRNVTLLSGEGSIGKSILLMQLLGATVLGGRWLGNTPEQGPALYLTAEEEALEVRQRMQAVATSLISTRKKLVEAGLRVLSFAGEDSVLAEPDRNGILRPTGLYGRILKDAIALKPKVIALDAAADVFGGNEINRAQTRQFITMVRRLAMATDSALILVAHPSLQGITSDSGLSGSTAWHNSVRARMYLKKAPGDDTSLRALEVKKNNYGPVTETILLRWQDGVYVAEGVGAPEEQAEQVLERLAEEEKIDQLFLTILRRFTKQRRNVSDKTGTTYAPFQFAKEAEAKKLKATADALADAMRRLFTAEKIRNVSEGPPSRLRTKIVEAEGKSTFSAASTDPCTDPSTALPPPTTGVCSPPPLIPPTGGGRGKRAVEGPAPSTSLKETSKRKTAAEETATDPNEEMVVIRRAEDDPDGIPFMITVAQKQQLRDQGFAECDIRELTPAQVEDILKPKKRTRRLSFFGTEPFQPCAQCGKTDGVIYHVKDDQHLNRPSINLHEGCIKAWLKAQDEAGDA